MKWYKNSLFGLTVLSLAFLSCNSKPQVKQTVDSRIETLPYYSDGNFTPYWFGDQSDSLLGFHKIPPFQLINQWGDTITEKTFENKIYVTDFFFTSCPGICPKLTANLQLVQEAFKDDSSVLLLSHSVTPDYDTVEVLRRYAEKNDIQGRQWHLVTGMRNEIYDLGRNAYFAEENLGVPTGESDFLHTENFILVDKNRNIRGVYNGLNKAP